MSTVRASLLGRLWHSGNGLQGATSDELVFFSLYPPFTAKCKGVVSDLDLQFTLAFSLIK